MLFSNKNVQRADIDQMMFILIEWNIIKSNLKEYSISSKIDLAS